jgi:hypothetical protein
MKAGLAFVVAVALSLPAVARADLDAGVQAYQAGDYPTAFREWWAAAEGGDIRAQVRLAGLYEKGLGVERNVVEALRWYDLAAAAGDAEAKASRDALAAGMSPDQVVRARDRATAWIDKHQRANPPLAGPPSVGQPLPRQSAPTAATVVGLETAAGSDSVLVKAIQRRLSTLGYDPGPADGVAGERTARAIRAFQRSAGLTVDGRPSQPLLVRLESTQAPAGRRSSTGTGDADQGKLVGAIISGDVGTVRRLVAGGRVDVDDVRTVGGSKWSVLRQAVVQPKASPEMVKVLLDAGASDAPGTPCDEQALSSAILHSTVAVVRALLAGGLDPNACNALAEALAVWESKPEMVTALLAAGADPNVPANAWSGPPLATVKSPILVKALVAAGADVNWANDGNTSVLAKHVLNCKMSGAAASDNVAVLLDAGATVTPQVRDLAFSVRDTDPACAKVYDLISSR